MSELVLMLIFMFFIIISIISLMMYKTINGFLLCFMVVSCSFSFIFYYMTENDRLVESQAKDLTYIDSKIGVVSVAMSDGKISNSEEKVFYELSKLTNIDFMTSVSELKNNPNSDIFKKRLSVSIKDLKTYRKDNANLTTLP